ncbi:MAG: type-F conjugative transfer system secretin TraK [Pseudomonadota bacterium]
MKIYRSGFLLSCCLISIPSWCETMQDDRVIDIAVSAHGMTRVSVRDDEISELYYYPDDLSDHVQLHKSGHLFIAGEGLKRPLFVTVMTSKGEVQDLRIQTHSKSPKPITLASSKVKKVDVNTIQAWLEDFGRGFVPAGFQRMPLVVADRGNASMTAAASDCFANDSHEVVIFAVKNVGDKVIKLDPQHFSRPGEGVHVRKKVLKPNEITKLVTIRKKGNET